MAVRKTNVNLPIKQTRPLRFMLGMLLTGVVVVGGAILLGKSDTGQIDVSATIIDAQTSATESGDGDASAAIIPAQPLHADLPNGGLVSTNSAVPPPQAEILPEPEVEGASTTASSTPEGEGLSTEESTEPDANSEEVAPEAN